ncbi:MAG TPA: FAD-dependent monooxygenase, partial [Ktedonobacteraceae bacterium]|nr:FAD-dependent monooxygenase [Ktedonobacteraceae bacterium]
MKIVILGGGPAGLYSGLLIKKANPTDDITIIERNAADVTYGWGVVFSDRTLASFQRADNRSYEQITDHFVIWDTIDVYYRNQRMSCGGHVISSISRKTLLNILQNRCFELGINLKFSNEINDLTELADYDLLIAADGLNSIVRKTYESSFKPSLEYGKARYIWLGANKVLDAFTFIFCENDHGLFQVHSYPFNGTTSTFIIECDEASWVKAGLDKADEAQSLAYCQQLLEDRLNGATLLSNNSKWISFPMLKTQHWHHKNIVLLGDAIHTAHFSIGSGTKLAMEDAIALASALEQHVDLETALNEYELERKPVVEIFQKAARESQSYFETLKRYMTLDPLPFTFNLLTRSGRITYDDLRLRDQRFGDFVDRWYTNKATSQSYIEHSSKLHTQTLFAPPPLFTSLTLRSVRVANRVALSPRPKCAAQNGLPTETYTDQIQTSACSGPGLVNIEQVAISAQGRITPECAGIYHADHTAVWKRVVEFIHNYTSSKVAIQLNHAGRRGSTRSRANGLDIPLPEGNWPLFSASSIPYSPSGQVPKEMDRADMISIRDAFVLATQRAQEAEFDIIQLNFAQGYLLASFISPLTNHRKDEFGGDLQHRMRFPLEIFDAVRANWPQNKPVSVTISASDCVNGGFEVDDAVTVAQTLKEHGCDIIAIVIGQTTINSEPSYGRGFLTPFSDRIRNEGRIPTMVG